MTGYIGIITAVIAFAVTAASGLFLIPLLRRLKFGQTIKEIGPTWHKNKQGTPTMGGIMFILGIVLASAAGYFSLLLTDPALLTAADSAQSIRFWAGLVMAVLFGAVGFLDDYIKVAKKRNLGLNAKQKTVFQLLIATGYVVALKLGTDLSTIVEIPFIGQLDFSFFYYPLAVLGIYFIVNAVNLTDGVDGLCGSVTFAGAILFIVITGMTGFAGAGILSTALAGGCLGFLVWNFHPAKVFMGDTGSMFLGGMVIALAFGVDNPLLLLFTGIIYIVEALSVVIQVISFKTTGKRVFKMSPIHHHFEMCGWSEEKIVAVFTVVTVLFGLLGVASVRLR